MRAWHVAMLMAVFAIGVVLAGGGICADAGYQDGWEAGYYEGFYDGYDSGYSDAINDTLAIIDEAEEIDR